MKTLLLALTAVALTAAVAVGQTTTPAPATRHFVQTDTHFKFLDVPPKGGERKPPSAGDEYLIGGALKENGAAAGTTDIICVVTIPGAHGASACQGTAVLKDGEITFQGASLIATNGDAYAITGGTGAYASAKGTIQTSEGKGGTENISVQIG